MKNKIIGLYQLATGIYGAIYVLYEIIVAIIDKKPDIPLTNLLGMLLFVGVAYAGYAMLNKVKRAVTWSIIAQLVQIVSFATTTFEYSFSGSAYLSLKIPSKLLIDTRIEAIDYYIGSSGQTDQVVHIYIVPIILVLLMINKPKK